MPVLMIPAGWGGETIGENVLIAWNRSREERRAVNDAIPFINSASNVTILNIDSGRNPERFGTEPGANLLAPLSRHGASSEEQTSKLQSLMRISYADFCLKKK